MRRFLRFALILFLSLTAASSPGAPVSIFFPPNATDPAINAFNNNHAAFVDANVPTRGQLVLFLPATGAVPFNYTAFLENAAGLGFHALGLMYPNAQPINELAALSDPLNPLAAGDARREVIDGTDRVAFLSVDRVNSIENRLLKALQFLAFTRPQENWNQFYDASGVRWEKLRVCGHSQGGGHAGVLAKSRLLAGCVMFSSMDYWVAGQRPYEWVGEPSLTPLGRWYLVSHERDPLLPFANVQKTAATLGLERFSAYRRVDDGPPPYEERHFLTTNLEPARGASGSYHGTAITDVDSPRTAGVPVLKPVWDTALTKDTPEARLINVSTRLRTGTGDEVAIAGFAVRVGAKRVAVRVLGPSLSAFGVGGALVDPALELTTAEGLSVARNDDWQSADTAAALIEAGLAPGSPRECGLDSRDASPWQLHGHRSRRRQQ